MSPLSFSPALIYKKPNTATTPSHHNRISSNSMNNKNVMPKEL